jgi:hypothetical protein
VRTWYNKQWNVYLECTDKALADKAAGIMEALLGTGKFVEYTDTTHLIKDTNAKRGGIYLKEGHHVVMALENGSGK